MGVVAGVLLHSLGERAQRPIRLLRPFFEFHSEEFFHERAVTKLPFTQHVPSIRCGHFESGASRRERQKITSGLIGPVAVSGDGHTPRPEHALTMTSPALRGLARGPPEGDSTLETPRPKLET